MPAALPKGPGTRTFSGARCIFLFNGQVFGFASGCDGREEVMYEPVEVLDNLPVKEHVPVGYRTTFRARIFRTIARGGASDAKENPGSLKELGMFPKLSEILRLQGVDAILQDRISGKTIWHLKECKTASYDFNVTARGVVAQDVEFVGITAEDESEVPAPGP